MRSAGISQEMLETLASDPRVARESVAFACMARELLELRSRVLKLEAIADTMRKASAARKKARKKARDTRDLIDVLTAVAEGQRLLEELDGAE